MFKRRLTILATFIENKSAYNNSFMDALNGLNLFDMIKFLAISTICFSSFLSFAQPQKGTWIIGGSGSVFFQRPASDNPIDFRINAGVHPGIGRFVSDRLVLSGDVGYSFTLSEQGTVMVGTKYEEHSIDGGIGLTRYFSIGEQLFFTLNGSLDLGYARGVSSVENNNLFNSSSSLANNQLRASINLSPGLAYFVNANWMITTQIGSLFYQISSSDQYPKTGHLAGYRFTANSFGIGVSYLIPSKKSE